MPNLYKMIFGNSDKPNTSTAIGDKEAQDVSTHQATVVSTDNSTSTPLAAAAVFTGAWEERKSTEMVIAIASDQDLTYQAQFSVDGTNVDSTLTFYYRVGVAEQPKYLVIARKYFRIVVTNTSASDQTYLRMQISQGNYQPLNAPLNGIVTQDHGAAVVRNMPFEMEVSQGKYIGYELTHKYGQNKDIDTFGITLGAFETVWEIGGEYTGFPTGSPEEFQITTGDTATSGTVTFNYLADTDSTSYIFVDVSIPANTITVATGITGIRSNRAVWNGGSAGGLNLVTLSCNHVTTTANVFWSIEPGAGQSRVCAYTVPYKTTGYLKQVLAHVEQNQNAVIVSDIWIRDKDKSPRFIRPFTFSNTFDHQEDIFGGIKLEAQSDFQIVVTTSTANNVPVSANMDFLIVSDQDL